MQNESLVNSIREKCRICYTCVRECPAKAIRVEQGQAQVIHERCIGCGNCVIVCSQKAKLVQSGIETTKNLLSSGEKIAAIIAPSFPAAFTDISYKTFVGMLRRLNFHMVNEVSFGADLVASEYIKLIEKFPAKSWIASTCPSIVGYIERYYPELNESLAPIVSPMIATARALRHLHGENLKIVFVGPCIAKKGEECADKNSKIDAVLTFTELKNLFEELKIRENIKDSEFDPPHANLGYLFPITRGLLQTARFHEDVLLCDVVAIEGKNMWLEAIREFSHKELAPRLLEVLCCRGGCIMGPGIENTEPLFKRRARVIEYTKKRIEKSDEYLELNIDLGREFRKKDQRFTTPTIDEITEVLSKIGKTKIEDELNCGACGYETCKEHGIAIIKGLAEKQMCLPYMIDRLKETVREIEKSHQEIARFQHQLIQSEKLASMGQMAAGIAHEVNNPLGVILMYAHLLLEQYESSKELNSDLKMIVEQASRCKKILSGLLNFARQNKILPEETVILNFVTNTLKLISIPDGININVSQGEANIVASIDRDQMAQALINIYNNAIDAMGEKGSLETYISENSDMVSIKISDTGCGIQKEHLNRIFEPFFTTKQMGKGTGLGLAVTYGIIKMHRGQIFVTTNADKEKGETGTIFDIRIPKIL
ncbi:MAG: 4Fe-4S binding protein [Desulfobacterales bacterium]|nr:4Fe-4S binding protein [Desulfobacterales bacterium]